MPIHWVEKDAADRAFRNVRAQIEMNSLSTQSLVRSNRSLDELML
jgi:hypothetical protein